jgi:hypothetical protein
VQPNTTAGDLLAPAFVVVTVAVVATRFAVVDARGSIVDLAAIVHGHARALAAGELDADTLFDHQLVDGGALRMQVSGVRVCTGFHVPASSHTGREMEADAGGEVDG